jgi:radical SAM superfamily enzyme YgiQ (UPF0313 family)
MNPRFMCQYFEPHERNIKALSGAVVHELNHLIRLRVFPWDMANTSVGDYIIPDYSRPYALDPPPRRAILPRESFLTTTSVIATRGCHNRCGFCYLSTDGLHMPYRMREVQQVVDEISADGQPYVVFVDNNVGSRPAYLRKLCEALRPLGIIWSAAVTIDVTDDPTLVHDMARAGCTGVFVGFESLNEGNLTDARKRTPAPLDYARRVELLHRYGIQVNGSFVLGFDHDGPDVFARTVEWIEDNRLECATFHILTPYPGTPLFRQLETQGRILHRDWDKYDTAHVVFQPKHMSCDELRRRSGRSTNERVADAPRRSISGVPERGIAGPRTARVPTGG